MLGYDFLFVNGSVTRFFRNTVILETMMLNIVTSLKIVINLA